MARDGHGSFSVLFHPGDLPPGVLEALAVALRIAAGTATLNSHRWDAAQLHQGYTCAVDDGFTMSKDYHSSKETPAT